MENIDNNTYDMSELLKRVSNMLEKNEIPDNFKNILNNTNTSKSQENFTTNENDFNNIDINTILKIKNIMDGLNSKNDPRTNLLRSLKPYLKESKKNKIEQYIQFLNMEKILEILKKSGDDNK